MKKVLFLLFFCSFLLTAQNYSLYFDGVDDYVDCGSGSSLNLTDGFTVEIWAKVVSGNGWHPALIAKSDNDHNYGWYLIVQSELGQRITFQGAISTSYYFRCLGNLWQNSWKHYAAVYTNGEQRLYEDGVLVAIDNKVGDCQIVTEPLFIGKNVSDAYLNAYLSKARISNTVRYTSNFTPSFSFENDAHTVALYNFDEGTGSTLSDYSGNNNHGTIYGATWSTDVLPVELNT